MKRARVHNTSIDNAQQAITVETYRPVQAREGASEEHQQSTSIPQSHKAEHSQDNWCKKGAKAAYRLQLKIYGKTYSQLLEKFGLRAMT